MLHCANGKHIPTVDLVVRKAGETPLEYIKIKLEKVIVSSLSTGGSGGEDKLTENVSLNFAKVTINYQEQNATGGKEGGEITFTWDIEANVK